MQLRTAPLGNSIMQSEVLFIYQAQVRALGGRWLRVGRRWIPKSRRVRTTSDGSEIGSAEVVPLLANRLSRSAVAVFSWRMHGDGAM